MGGRAKVAMPLHIDITFNTKTGFYESEVNGFLYQLTFTQMNAVKSYCRQSKETIEDWYMQLSRFDKKEVKRLGNSIDDSGFFPDIIQD